jgi:hypothetical protein
VGIILENIGYFNYEYKFYNVPKNFRGLIKYIVRLILLNIKSPLNNKLLNKTQNWHIIDCNLELEHSKRYIVKGNFNELRALKNILLKNKKQSKGNIHRHSKVYLFEDYLNKRVLLKNCFFLISKKEYEKHQYSLTNIDTNTLIIFCEDIKDLNVEKFGALLEFKYKRLS